MTFWFVVFFRLNSTFLEGLLVLSVCQERFIWCLAFYLSPTCFFLLVTSPCVLAAFNSTGIRSMFTMFFCDSGGGVLRRKISVSIEDTKTREKTRSRLMEGSAESVPQGNKFIHLNIHNTFPHLQTSWVNTKIWWWKSPQHRGALDLTVMLRVLEPTNDGPYCVNIFAMNCEKWRHFAFF